MLGKVGGRDSGRVPERDVEERPARELDQVRVALVALRKKDDVGVGT
jgi:hypothetical protein